MKGHGGGQVVSVLAINSDDPSMNPAEAWIFSVEFVLGKNENKQKWLNILAYFASVFTLNLKLF